MEDNLDNMVLVFATNIKTAHDKARFIAEH